MGGAINRSFINAHFLLSIYFLTAQTYKRMCLITRVYGMCSMPISNQKNGSLTSYVNGKMLFDPTIEKFHLNPSIA